MPSSNPLSWLATAASALPPAVGWSLGAALLLALVVALASRRRRHHYLARSLMTDNELEFFRRLLAAWPDGFVFPQVAMSALIEPHPRLRRAADRMAAFGRIAQKRVDWAIYDAAMNLVCIVELDDRTHDAARDADRDAMLASAGIETLRWTSRRKPPVADLARELRRLAGR